MKHIKHNSFYSEYRRAIEVAQQILKRFGYSISKYEHKKKVETPPFWIDMTKLFEAYILGLLLKEYGKKVHFQFSVGQGNELDFLLENPKLVIDTKYKPQWGNSTLHQDVRQVSGYARLNKV